MIIGINITLMHLLTLIVGDLSIYNYIFCIILYYLVLQYATELIVDGYIDLAAVQCKRKLIDQEVKNITNNKQVNFFYPRTDLCHHSNRQKLQIFMFANIYASKKH